MHYFIRTKVFVFKYIYIYMYKCANVVNAYYLFQVDTTKISNCVMNLHELIRGEDVSDIK